MQVYMEPIFIALVIFAMIALMVFIPWVIHLYRKFGYFPFSTTIIVFSFIFYFLAALFLTMLPLPETRHNCFGGISGPLYSLKPFQFVDDILRESRVVWTNPATYIQLLHERAFLQAFFNLLLLMPLGVYLRYYLGKRRAWWKAMLVIGAVTFFYEVTQVTGIYGIYDCPYRVFDVDDLILNTAGGLLGFFIAPIILALFPSRKRVQEKAAELLARDEVRNMAVLIAMGIDLLLVQLAVSILAPATGYTDLWSRFILLTVVLLVSLVVIPTLHNGQTIGTQILRFRYTGERLISKLTKRMLAIWLIYAIQFTASVIGEIEFQFETARRLVSVWHLFAIGISTVLVIVLIIHIFVVLFSRERRRLFFDAYADITTTRKRKRS